MKIGIWLDLKEDIKGIAKGYKLDDSNMKIIYREFEVAGAVKNKEEIENKYNMKFEEVIL